MPTVELSRAERDLLRKLREQLSDYFSEDPGSRNRAMKSLGVHHSTLDRGFINGNIQVTFLSRMLDQLGLTFEDLVWDALNFGPERGKTKIRQRLRVEPEKIERRGDQDSQVEEFLRRGERRLQEIEEDEGDASEDSRRSG